MGFVDTALRFLLRYIFGVSHDPVTLLVMSPVVLGTGFSKRWAFGADASHRPDVQPVLPVSMMIQRVSSLQSEVNYLKAIVAHLFDPSALGFWLPPPGPAPNGDFDDNICGDDLFGDCVLTGDPVDVPSSWPTSGS